jgi:hypothetical protein
MSFSEKFSEKAIPVCIEEVFICLQIRYKNSKHDLFYNNPENSSQKIWNYCKELCILKKEKIKEIRFNINRVVNEKFLNDEEQVQAGIILCKIIDFKYLTFNSWISIFPGYKKYFKPNKFRKLYKILHSIISN